MEINSHDFKPMYTHMGIDINKLGCVTLSIRPILTDDIEPEDLYYSSNPDRYWIKGLVCENNPHVTLLYGLIKTKEFYDNDENYQYSVNKVLKEWKVDDVQISHIGFFDSPFEDDPYYCIVAHVKQTESILEGHRRLSLLPHINTYGVYAPHITIAYIRKDDNLLMRLLQKYNSWFAIHKPLYPITKINIHNGK